MKEAFSEKILFFDYASFILSGVSEQWFSSQRRTYFGVSPTNKVENCCAVLELVKLDITLLIIGPPWLIDIFSDVVRGIQGMWNFAILYAGWTTNSIDEICHLFRNLLNPAVPPAWHPLYSAAPPRGRGRGFRLINHNYFLFMTSSKNRNFTFSMWE